MKVNVRFHTELRLIIKTLLLTVKKGSLHQAHPIKEIKIPKPSLCIFYHPQRENVITYALVIHVTPRVICSTRLEYIGHTLAMLTVREVESRVTGNCDATGVLFSLFLED